MKRIIVILSIIFATNFAHAQKIDSATFYVTDGIIHAGIVVPTGEIQGLQSALSGNEANATAFADYVVKQAKKIGTHLSYVYRGNCIEFKSTNLPYLNYKCIFWLIPQEGEGIVTVRYHFDGREHSIDEWLYLPAFVREVKQDLVRKDDIKEFSKYSKICAYMVKNKMHIPDCLYSRLSGNFFNDSTYLTVFYSDMVMAGLSPKIDKGNIIKVKTTYMSYTFNALYREKWPLNYIHKRE